MHVDGSRAVCRGVCRGQRVTVDTVRLAESPEADRAELETALGTMRYAAAAPSVLRAQSGHPSADLLAAVLCVVAFHPTCSRASLACDFAVWCLWLAVGDVLSLRPSPCPPSPPHPSFSRSALSSPNLSVFFGVCVDRTKGGDGVQHNELLLVSEPFQMTVHDLLFAQEDVPVSPHLALLIAQDAAHGLHWLHRTVTWGWGVCLENIRLDSRYRAKVVSPTLAEADRDEKSDVYEYGFVFHFLVVAASLWGDHERIGRLRGEYHAGELPLLPPDVSHDVANVAEWCRCDDKSDRPLFPTVVSLVNRAVLRSAVPDEAACEWWYDRFGTTESLLAEVGWKTFRKEFLGSFASRERWTDPNASTSESEDDSADTESWCPDAVGTPALTGKGAAAAVGCPRRATAEEIDAAVCLLRDCTVLADGGSSAKPTSTELLRGATQQEVVTLERFGNFVECFGGLARPQEFFINV